MRSLQQVYEKAAGEVRGVREGAGGEVMGKTRKGSVKKRYPKPKKIEAKEQTHKTKDVLKYNILFLTIVTGVIAGLILSAIHSLELFVRMLVLVLLALGVLTFLTHH